MVGAFRRGGLMKCNWDLPSGNKYLSCSMVFEMSAL